MSSSTCSSSDDERDSAWAQVIANSKVLPLASLRQQPNPAASFNSLPAIDSSSSCCSSSSSDDEAAGIDISKIVFSRIDWDKQEQTNNTVSEPQQNTSRKANTDVVIEAETTPVATVAQPSKCTAISCSSKEASESDASDVTSSSGDDDHDDVDGDGDISSTGNGWLSGAAGRIANLNTPRRQHDWDQVQQGIAPLLCPKTPQQLQAEEHAITQHFMATTSDTQPLRAGVTEHINPDGLNSVSSEACTTEYGTDQQAADSCSAAAVVLHVGGMDIQDLDQLIARLQAGSVYDLSTTRPSDLPDPSTLFTDDEDDDMPTSRPANNPAISLDNVKVETVRQTLTNSNKEQNVSGNTTTLIEPQQATGRSTNSTASMELHEVRHQQAQAQTIPDGHRTQQSTLPTIPHAMPLKFGGKFRMLPQTSQAVQPAAPLSSLQSQGMQDNRRTVTVDLRSSAGVAGHATAVPQKAVEERSGSSKSGTTLASRSMFVSTCDMNVVSQQLPDSMPQPSTDAVATLDTTGTSALQPEIRHVLTTAKPPAAVSVQMDTEDDWPASSLQLASQGVQSYNRIPVGAPGRTATSNQDDGLCIVTAGTCIVCPAGSISFVSKQQAAVACESACQCDAIPEDDVRSVSASFSPRCSTLSNLENGPALGVGHCSISSLRQNQAIAA